MSDTEARDRLIDLIEWAETDTYATSQPDGMARTTILATAILDAGWRPPARTVSTVEEAEALPDGTLVVTRTGGSGYIWRRYVHATFPALYYLEWAIEHYGPLTVVWEPEDGE